MKDVPLSSINAVFLWGDTPAGAVLQLTIGGQNIVGMRFDFRAETGTIVRAIIILEGGTAGGVILQDADSGKALDVTDCVEILAVESQTFNSGPYEILPPGSVLQFPNDGKVFYMVGSVYDNFGNARLLNVCISSANPTHIVGTGAFTIDRSATIGVASALKLVPRA